MYSIEEFNELIKENVSKVNYHWFLEKEKQFKLLSGNKELLEIENIGRSPIYSMEVDEEINVLEYETVENIILIDLPQYVECYLPIDESTYWGKYPGEASPIGTAIPTSNNTIEFATQLVSTLAKFAEGEKESSRIHKFISKVIQLLEQELADQKEKNTNPIYREILGNFLNVCTSKLYDRFARELTMYNLTNDFTDYLKFDLEQQELAALLFIIQRGQFLKYTDTSFLRFCTEHFTFNEHGKSVKPSSLKNFTSAYSKVTTSQAPSSKQGLHTGLQNIATRLMMVLKTINAK